MISGFHIRRTGSLSKKVLNLRLSNTKDDEEITKFLPNFRKINDNQRLKLLEFCYLIRDWNTKVNLISRKDIDYLVPNHLLPSISVSLIHDFKPKERVIDIGCGGGFPGLPLSILHPDTHFTLIDSNNKKIKIVEDIAKNLKLSNLNVICARAETIKEKFDTLLGRAVSAIPNFLGYCSHLQEQTSKSGLYYIKGGDFIQELHEAQITDYSLTPIQQMLPALSTDKFILYIPSHEIVSFHHRYLQNKNNS
jgi:16S rRNA (guanine527-N7)-methyltransferase